MPPNLHYLGKPPWGVPTIHERVLARSDELGIAKGMDDDAQIRYDGHSPDEHYEVSGTYELEPGAYGLPAWDDPDDN